MKYDEYEKFKRTGEKETFKWARNDVPRFAFASSQLLNDNLLFRLDKATLRMMRNEILMHHGYMPSSADLLQYLEGKEWFSPLTLERRRLRRTHPHRNAQHRADKY